MRQVVECHCESCRRITGVVWYAIGARLAHVTNSDDGGKLNWCRSSELVERGFCGNCGSTMSFPRDGADTITARSLDQLTGLILAMRICTDNMADYAADTSGDGIPRFPELPPMNHFALPEE